MAKKQVTGVRENRSWKKNISIKSSILQTAQKYKKGKLLQLKKKKAIDGKLYLKNKVIRMGNQHWWVMELQGSTLQVTLQSKGSLSQRGGMQQAAAAGWRDADLQPHAFPRKGRCPVPAELQLLWSGQWHKKLQFFPFFTLLQDSALTEGEMQVANLENNFQRLLLSS